MDYLERIKELSLGDTNRLKTKGINSLYENTTIDGITLCIVQESNSRFVIKVNNNGELLLPEGLENKHLYTRKTYKLAKNKLDGMINSFNEAAQIESINESFRAKTLLINETKTYKETNLFEDDRYVLKVDAPKGAPLTYKESSELDPFAEPSTDSAGLDFADDMELSEPSLEPEADLGGDLGSDAGGKVNNDFDPKKVIQKETGSLAHNLREYKEEDRSELDNYVFKSILAALDWKNISQETIESFKSKIDEKFEENAQQGDIGELDDELRGDLGNELDTDLGSDLGADLGTDDLGGELSLEALSYLDTDDLDVLFEKYEYCNKHNSLLSECGCGCSDHDEEEEEEIILVDDMEY